MKEYEYRVTAINDGGESDSSECSKPIKAKPLKGKANTIIGFMGVGDLKVILGVHQPFQFVVFTVHGVIVLVVVGNSHPLSILLLYIQ